MRRMISAVAILTAIGFSALASAQQDRLDTSPNNFTIRGGVALPVDQSLSNVSNTFIDVGVEYLFNSSLIKGGETYLSIDGFFNNFNGVTAYPVAINQRFFTGTSPSGRRSYYFVGVGVTWTDVTNQTFDAISARGGIGTELGQNIIAELAGYISNSAGGTRANAVTINLGYRF
jgi:hypothetical protein